jgi:4-methylaminobutanoate oxidase (formaldehyde-forming)
MEMESARGLRRSAIYDRLAAKGARFGSKMGWERVNWFAPPDEKFPYGWKPAWLDRVRAEQAAAREGVAIIDQSSFAKIRVQGRDACAFLQRVCANDVDVPVGNTVYTGILNARGGFEADVTLIRTEADSYLLITGSAQLVRDMDWLVRRLDGASVALCDASALTTTLSLLGPQSKALLAKICPSIPDLKLGASAVVDVGLARVRLLPMGYAGGAGYEMHVATDCAASVYDALCEAARGAFDLRDIGYYALDALRIEAGRRAYGPELGSDETPVEAGLMHAVALSKPDFVGKQAILAKREAGVAKRLVMLALEDPNAWLWGGEGILADGRPAGEISSAGWSTTLGRVVAMGYVRAPEPFGREEMLRWKFSVDVAGDVLAARALPKAAYPAAKS